MTTTNRSIWADAHHQMDHMSNFWLNSFSTTRWYLELLAAVGELAYALTGVLDAMECTSEDNATKYAQPVYDRAIGLLALLSQVDRRYRGSEQQVVTYRENIIAARAQNYHATSPALAAVRRVQNYLIVIAGSLTTQFIFGPQSETFMSDLGEALFVGYQIAYYAQLMQPVE